MRHKSVLSLPTAGGKTVVVMTGGSSTLNVDQLYLYVSNSDTDFLAGRGQLYVLRAARGALAFNSQSASRVKRGSPVSGQFVAVDGASARSPASLDAVAQNLGCLNFSRLEGLALDREHPDSFYFTDRLGYEEGVALLTPAGAGRLYHVTLDAFDPTQVPEISVVLDATDGDDLYRPSGLDTDDQCIMIQEYPGSRGIRAARILRYDLRSHRVDPVADLAERDSRGRPAPSGIGGEWEPSAMTNVSDLFGEDSWLLTVQAHTVEIPEERGRYGEGGQLLLLRGPRNPAFRR
jgi:hypothetical protein